MKLRIAAGLVVIPLVGVGALLMGANEPKQREALQGAWKLAAGESEGKALPEKELQDGTLLIRGDHYTVELPGIGTITGRQELDPTKNPKTIDILDDSGANKGKMCTGIYEITRDEFRVAFAPPGMPRPTKFATEPNSGHWVHVWKRAAE